MGAPEEQKVNKFNNISNSSRRGLGAAEEQEKRTTITAAGEGLGRLKNKNREQVL